jgi:hypothetical protein
MAMSTLRVPIRLPLAAWLVAAYALAYLGASWLDLTTTVMALHRPEATEGNVYATSDVGYMPATAWLITFAGGAAFEACLIWSIVASGNVANCWLDHPIRSFAKLYVNPWSRRVRDRAPLHVMSFAIGFVLLRLVAALNNILIASTGTAPLGRLVGLASRATSPAIGFWLVIAPLFYILAIAVSPAASRIIASMRAQSLALPPTTP